MKKLLLLFSILLSGHILFAQGAPRAIKYQAVVRDINGDIVVSNNIKVKVSILYDNNAGNTVYSEDHSSLQSNQFGLINFDIGRGTSSDDFTGIDWSLGNYWVKIQLDIDGTGWTNMGTAELLSVPYAFYAENGGSLGYNLDDHRIPLYDEANEQLANSIIKQYNTGDSVLVEGALVVSNNAVVKNQLLITDTAFAKVVVAESNIHTLANVIAEGNVTAQSLEANNADIDGNLTAGSISSTGMISTSGTVNAGNVTTGNVTISGTNQTLTIGNYRFPTTSTGSNNGMFLSLDGTELKWKEANTDAGLKFGGLAEKTVPYYYGSDSLDNSIITQPNSGEVVVAGDLTANGTVDASDLTVDNDATVGADLTVIGTADMGTADVTNNLTVGDTVLADGVVVGNAGLKIGNYSFPKDSLGGTGKFLSLDSDGALKWKEAASGATEDSSWSRTGSGASDIVRNKNMGSVIVASPTNSDVINTTARFHVEKGDFVLHSSDEITDPLNTGTPPSNFNSTGEGNAGLMWWGNKHAFRVGRNDNDYLIYGSLNAQNAWKAENIGQWSIGIGRNVIAKDIGSFAIGANLFVGGGATSPSNFAIGMASSVEKRFAFNVGIQNKTLNQNSFIVGIANTIEPESSSVFGSNNSVTGDAPQTTIIGGSNTVENFTAVPATGSISVYGYGNKLSGNVSDISVLGNNNYPIDQSSHALVLGEDNKLKNGNNSSRTDNISILIGRNNIDEGSVDNNILIGIGNQPAGGDNIALGYNNKPRRPAGTILVPTASIFIGAGNEEIGTGKNIVIGESNKIQSEGANDEIGENIAIGNRITPKIDGAATRTPAEKNITIGNEIHLWSGGADADPKRSITIGNDISSGGKYGINIGRNITAAEREYVTIPVLGLVSQPGTSQINIGHGIKNNYDRAIVLGTNNEGAYPINGGNPTIPAFVVGQPATADGSLSSPITPPDFHYMYVDNQSNLWLGVKSDGTYKSNSGSILFARGATLVNAPVITSDRKFKSNIKPLSSGMEDYLYRIRSFSYTMNADETQRLNWGFIAQDVQLYFPHLVYEIDSEGGLGLNYTGFIPVLWKIAQDQQTRIDAQEARIEELERQIETINYFLEELMNKGER
ncbi:MAG: tail fiber domain-containing protein [Bacteroidales bacterium]|jgi:hypothetical protein|nr:tail fiber domain-containing protein [Bacteroidales bacterium]